MSQMFAAELTGRSFFEFWFLSLWQPKSAIVIAMVINKRTTIVDEFRCFNAKDAHRNEHLGLTVL
jgi:hypothetical protein